MKYRLALFTWLCILFTLILPACVVHTNLPSDGQAMPSGATDITSPSAGSAEADPCTPSTTLGANIASDKRVIAHAGGVNYGTHNDAEEFNSTTRPSGGDWLIETNSGDGTYQVIDLGKSYPLTGVGYYLQWDKNFANPLTMQIDVSSDQHDWMTATRVVHRHAQEDNMNWVNVDLSICPVTARYVKFWLPPDGEWNGWGNFFQLRVYASGEK